MTVKRRKPMPKAAEEPPRIRKAYMECRHGQLHVTTAFPVGGGFDEHATLVCLHRCGLSSRVFRAFMAEVGRDRSVYAPDLPGCGESDAPPQPPTIGDYAAAIADFLDQMRFRQVDVLGQHTGALIAAELALARPQTVRRLILVGLPILTGEERAVWTRSAKPLAPGADGSHLVEEWKRTVEQGDARAEPAAAAEDFAIRLHNGETSGWMAQAALGYAAAERLPLIAQPTLLVRNRDGLWDASLRAKPWMRNLKVLDLPEHGSAIFRAAPAMLAVHLRSFLDR